MRTIEKTIYLFSELNERAKEKARDYFRGNAFTDSYDWEGVYEDAKNIGALIGIEINDIYFSGFSSQGDGASFTGRYSYVKGGVKALKEYASMDTELHRIVDALQAVQRKNFYKVRTKIMVDGRYCHSNTMCFENLENPYVDVNSDVEQLLRDFADWIYCQLENEYDYQTSDEYIEENILANEYEFYENGKAI